LVGKIERRDTLSDLGLDKMLKTKWWTRHKGLQFQLPSDQSHIIPQQNRALKGDWTVGGQINRRTKKFIEWGTWRFVLNRRYFYGYHRTTVRLVGQETCSRETNNTHRICSWKQWMEEQVGGSRRGWRVKERQYKDLYLSITICIVFRSENYMFLLRYFKYHCTEFTERQILVSLNYLQNLS
jgi:hypothetical protein